MGELSKQSSWNTLLMYSGALIGALNTVFLYPKVMPKVEYGLITLMTSIAMLAAGFGSFGTTSAIIRFFPEYYNHENKKTSGLVWYLLKISLISSLMITLALVVFQQLIFSFFSKGAELLSDYYFFIIPIFLSQVFIDMLSNFLNGLKKSILPVFQREIYLRIGQTMCILLYYFDLIGLSQFVLIYSLLYITTLMILIGYAYSLKELKLFSDGTLTAEKRKGIWDYLGFTFFASMARQVSFRIDNIMVGALVVSSINPNRGLEASSVYNVALYMAVMVELPFRAMNNLLAPEIAKAWVLNNLEKVEDLYKRSTEIMTIVATYITLGIWVCVDQIVGILPPEYAEVKYVLWWLLLGKLTNVIGGPNGPVLSNSPKYKVLTIFSVLGLVITIISNYFFIMYWSIEGAALATFITYLVLNFLLWAVLFKEYRFQPFNWKNLVIILLAVIVYLVGVQLSFDSDFLSIVLKAIVVSLLYWVVILGTGWFKEVNGLFNGVLKRLYRR